MIQAVLTDIEGTTTSIAFVKDSLFPFAAAELDAFLAAHAEDPEVAACLAATPGADKQATLRDWMAKDVKATPLKTLQGLIWRQGYADGRLKGHVWPDVPECLRAWHAAGLRLAVYSSGSVEAQKLIFGHSSAGDLSGLFSGFFDTRIGGKREPGAYAAIAAAMDLPPAGILFLSDIGAELDAAAEAGLGTCQLLRPQDGTEPAPRHPQAPDFPAVATRFGLG
jgi:enolase-phosphatase E1